MDNDNKTNFEKRLEQIIGAESEVNAALDGLDDDNENNKVQLPTTVSYAEVPSVVTVQDGISQDLIDDYKFSRKTLYGLIDRGSVALEGALIIARESEHPRAFEVASTIMKTLSEVTKDLISLQKSITPTEVKIGKQVNTQNNFYSSTPSDVSDVLDSLEDSE